MKHVYTEVEVTLDDFDDDEILDELRSRDLDLEIQVQPSIQELYDAWVYKTGDYEDLFRRYCQATIGRSF
jgi:hypothetical protein